MADTAEQVLVRQLTPGQARVFRGAFWAAAAASDPEVLWFGLLAHRASPVAMAGHIHGEAATRVPGRIRITGWLTAHAGITPGGDQ